MDAGCVVHRHQFVGFAVRTKEREDFQELVTAIAVRRPQVLVVWEICRSQRDMVVWSQRMA